MAVITAPTILSWEAAKLTLKRATAELRSPFTGKRQVIAHPYAVWMFEGTMIRYDGVNAGVMRSFLAKMRGRANTVRMPVPGVTGPLSGITNNGQVNGTGQSGGSLATYGWGASKLVMREGDYFNIGDELKMCSADVSSNGSGQCTITFEPNLRASPADNTVVNVLAPYVYLSLEGDDGASWDLSAPVIHSFKLKGVEAL